MCRPPAAWPAGGAARRRRGPLAAPPGGGSARRRLTAGPKPAAARHPRGDRTPAGSRGSRPPAGFNFKLKNITKGAKAKIQSWDP